MSAPDVALRTAWQRLAGSHHEALLEGLLERLREPHRRYHTATHVMWVLRHVEHIVAAGGVELDGPEAVDLDAVRLAALYHDAVYDATRSDNEAVSADLAAGVAAELGWADDRQAAVHRLVMATAGHQPQRADEMVLVDADLAILGAEPKDYSAYVTGVRTEYALVGDEQWRTGRAEVLRTFLAMPVLFSTEVMRAERGARARANMAAELATLR